METNAYSRVRDLLRYARGPRWLAAACGVVTAFMYVFVVLLGALFADLLVSRGRIPNFAQLPVDEQQTFLNEWKALPEEDRTKALYHLGFSDLEANPAAVRVATDPAREKAFANLLANDGVELPPVPGLLTPDMLKEWAAKRKLSGEAYYVAATEHELRWRAYVWLYLQQRVNSAAADHWAPALPPGEAFIPPGLGEDNARPFGLLSLVVRERNTPSGRLAGVFANINGWTWHRENPNRAYAMGLFFLAVVLVFGRALLIGIMNEAAGRAALEVITRLRRSLYHHTARQGSMTISPEAVDEAGMLFTREVEQVHEALEYNLTNEWRYTVTFAIMLLLALVTHIWLSVAFLLFAVLVWALAGQLSGTFKRQHKIASRMAANRLELLLESLRLVRLVKSYLMELFNQARVERQLADYAHAHLRRTRGDAIARPLLVAVGTMAGLTLLYLGGRVILNGGLSIAGLVILMVSFLSMYYPVRARLAYRRMIRHGREAAATIFEFLDRRGDVAAYPDAEFFPGLAPGSSKGIEFNEVTVVEPASGQKLLKKLNWKVKAGSRIGIVASDHDEQMALVSLIPRFLDPTEGEIKIDGRLLKWLTQDSLRAQIGLVLQNSLIFNDTVANNIGCGDGSYTLPQIIEAAKVAHAHQFVQRLPYGYETAIGELGHSLSDGEMYRIALARAILRDPSIYIIEEPATQLDDDTKDLIDDTLERVLPGKTVLHLPHRVSTLKKCDKIYLLHEGVFVAAGDHRELVTENELYRHLYYLEFNPFAEKVTVERMAFEKELEGALKAAQIAGAYLWDEYAKFVPIPNAPSSISTDADRGSQELILQKLAALFPDDALCAEEKTPTLAHAKRTGNRLWIVDPIDGTRGFAMKNGEFSVMIGFVQDGEVVVGVVLEPAMNRVTFARKGGGCWATSGDGNFQLCRVKPTTTLAEATLVQSHARQGPSAPQLALTPKSVVETYSAGVKMAMVARGEVDLYVNTYPRFSDWDICAGDILVTEAGGTNSELTGVPIAYGKEGHPQAGGLLSSNGVLHAAALERLRGVPML